MLQNNFTSLLAVNEVRNKLQVVHCKARHHCTNNQVLIIDSLYSSLDDETKVTISQLFQSSCPVMKVIRPQKQVGVEDCGLFSTAFATSIAFGQNPARQKVNASTLSQLF